MPALARRPATLASEGNGMAFGRPRESFDPGTAMLPGVQLPRVALGVYSFGSTPNVWHCLMMNDALFVPDAFLPIMR